MIKNRRILVIIIFIIVTSFSLSSCQNPVEMAFEDICQVENNKKWVITEGYFTMGASLYCSDVSGEYRCGINLNSLPDGELSISAEVMEGKRKNHMLPLESGYTDADLQIKTADGDFVGVGEPVKITGELLVTESVCLIYVEKVENIE